MALKVGNSYVSETAVKQAANALDKEGSLTRTDQDYLKALRSRFQGIDIKIGSGSSATQANGTNNIVISQRVLHQMATDDKKRLEYESLLIDCANVQKKLDAQMTGRNRNILKQGFTIDANGQLSSWTVSNNPAGGIREKTEKLSQGSSRDWMGELTNTFRNMNAMYI